MYPINPQTAVIVRQSYGFKNFDLGWEVFDIDLVPNNGDTRLELLAQQVAILVDRIAPHQPIDLLGFSMGGLVTRYYSTF